MLNDYFPTTSDIERIENTRLKLFEVERFLTQLSARLSNLVPKSAGCDLKRVDPAELLKNSDFLAQLTQGVQDHITNYNSKIYDLVYSKDDKGQFVFPFLVEFFDLNRKNNIEDAMKCNLTICHFIGNFVWWILFEKSSFDEKEIKDLQDIITNLIDIEQHYLSNQNAARSQNLFSSGQKWFIELQKKYGLEFEERGECVGVAMAAVFATLEGNDTLDEFKKNWIKTAAYADVFENLSYIPPWIKTPDKDKLKKMLSEVATFQNFQHDALKKFKNINKIAVVTGIYSQSTGGTQNKNDIKDFLDDFLNKLNSQDYTGSVAMVLSANHHSICVSFDTTTKFWTLTDANNLPALQFKENDTIELAKAIKRCFVSPEQQDENLLMGADVFCKKEKNSEFVAFWQENIFKKYVVQKFKSDQLETNGLTEKSLFYALDKKDFASFNIMLDDMIAKGRFVPRLATKFLSYILSNNYLENINNKDDRKAIISKFLKIGANPNSEYGDGHPLQFYVEKYCSDSPREGILSTFFKPYDLDKDLQEVARTRVVSFVHC